jgi:DNA-binding NarL/FixJ family response regulator
LKFGYKHLIALDRPRSAKVVRVWYKDLTPREHEVVRLLKRNLSNDKIARKLGIKRGTVKVHVHNIVKKLGLSPRLRRWRWSRGAATAAGRKRIEEAQRRRWQRWNATRSAENT